ncbi:MAG: Gfo/Idh/MocA family oxidoreductase [Lentisphaerae bacterium]|nr:Gfo/Idh/MocA family oxidoreductase [Lentisphaerota bacterium]MBT4814432.1 Gfo/Idh/MocA family oxidoreductase [Lentisphaerota bacterium]MBT5611053.1 Gfo/Idh/MocA family oxidoreductase [Lentisphaerota bacterium]MBT7053888.1 Gfo/Idh/MocA family oxidoreductase [Lentisphaerota bacterium]MBT7840509.1 Gfo/Idh/MocA family oxidoreductase [Lentisphaerota bacterium]
MSVAPFQISSAEHGVTRRRFLGRMALASGAAAAPYLIPASARGADGAVSPGNRITLGLIGHGRMGQGHLRWCLGRKDAQVLAVCDVDTVRREEAQRRANAAYAGQRASGAYKGCAAYNDYRELLARPDIDAVVIVTPDHWHALIAADAARAGKDIYCEKPVSLTIQEGRRLAEVVTTYGRVFQTGTQYRSMPKTRRICNFVRNGGLGRVKQAFALWSRCEGSLVPVNPRLPSQPVPEGLDWDLWVGPAAWHDYNQRYHRNPIPGVVPWAFCEDFGAASVTWHHSHSADVIQYAIGQERSGPVAIHHPADSEFPTLTYRYADGTLLHLVGHWGMVKKDYGAVPDHAQLGGNFGGLFVGERGWITSMYGAGPTQGEPQAIFREMRRMNGPVLGNVGHHSNWLQCIKSRARTSTDEEIGHRSASLGHLAIVAFKLGRSLIWDPVREVFPGDAEANRLCSRAMRQPWRL